MGTNPMVRAFKSTCVGFQRFIRLLLCSASIPFPSKAVGGWSGGLYSRFTSMRQVVREASLLRANWSIEPDAAVLNAARILLIPILH